MPASPVPDPAKNGVAEPHPLWEALSGGFTRDRILLVGSLLLAATTSLLLSGALGTEAGLPKTVVVLQIALLIISLQWGLQRIPQREERRFWTDLTLGCGLWALSIILSYGSEDAAHLVRSFFYLAFLFAVERDLERRPGLHRVDYGRTLRWPGGTVFVFGLLTYFLLIPIIVTGGRTDLPPASMFLVLDLYLGAQFFLRRRQIRYFRWRLLYGLLGVGMAMLALIDLALLFEGAREAVRFQALWTLPIFFFLLAGRLRHQPMSTQESLFDSVRRKDELSLPKERMIIFALAFPVIHLGASLFQRIDPTSRLAREATVLGWLFLVGALALVQQRLLEKKARSLWMERMRAEEALHKSEETLRLINERMEAQRALRISEEKFAKAFRASPDSVVIATFPEGRIIEVNDGTENVTGYSRDEILQRTAVEMGLWVDPQRREQLIKELRRHRSIRDFAFELRRASGEIAIAEISAELLELDGEEHLLLIVRDMTDQKKLEQEILQNRRMEGLATLAGGLAHDLNNVLTPIVMTTQLLRNKLSGQDENRTLISTLEKNALRGASMVKGVMSLARGAEGERVRLDPHSLLTAMEKIAQESFPSGIRLKTQVVVRSEPRDPDSGDRLWQIEGDPTQLHRALLNLCENAREAIEERDEGTREIMIEAENIYLDQISARVHSGATEGNYVVLSVTDTGVGIPTEIQDRIFDPFFTTKGVGKGAGLGLSTTSAIIKNHHGFMNLYSEPGNGTRMQIFLPAELEFKNMNSTEHLDLPFGKGETILVVDDEVAVREITRQALETFGYHGLIAANGAEGVEIYQRRADEIDLVLLDMIMPVMDGAKTLEALREINPDVRVMAMSGLNLKERRRTGGNIRLFLAKPFTAVRLLGALREALDDERPKEDA